MLMDGDEILAIFPDNVSREDRKTIELANEAKQQLISFVEAVNSGNYKPRTTVKEIEQFIKKYE